MSDAVKVGKRRLVQCYERITPFGPRDKRNIRRPNADERHGLRARELQSGRSRHSQSQPAQDHTYVPPTSEHPNLTNKVTDRRLRRNKKGSLQRREKKQAKPVDKRAISLAARVQKSKQRQQKTRTASDVTLEAKENKVLRPSRTINLASFCRRQPSAEVRASWLRFCQPTSDTLTGAIGPEQFKSRGAGHYDQLEIVSENVEPVPGTTPEEPTTPQGPIEVTALVPDDPMYEGYTGPTITEVPDAVTGPSDEEAPRRVHWLGTESPAGPISSIRLYDPMSRIDSSPPVPRQMSETAASPTSEMAEEEPQSFDVAHDSGVPFIKPLSAKWQAKIESAMASPENRQLATTLGGDPLTRRDLATCHSRYAWLNDEIINAYLALIVDYARRAAGNYGRHEKPKFHAFNSFFFSNLRDKGYESVRRWATRAKIGKEALLGVDTVLVPIHDHAHWTLLVIKPAARTIEHFDSLGSLSRAHVARAMTWLRGELGNLFVEEEWRVLPSVSPQQDNGSDCGVFLLTSAKMTALGMPLFYEARDIPDIRKRIVAELINGGFEGDFDPKIEFPPKAML